MSATATAKGGSWRKNGAGKPTWDVALLFPPQGEWTEDEFLALEARSENRMMELVDGFLEVLPMPDVEHQRIVKFLLLLLDQHVRSRRLGEVLCAPLPVRLRQRHLREPDIVFLKSHRVKDPHLPPEGTDLALEVVSPGSENRKRDLREKRAAYAKARIPEYWVVDPLKKEVTVFTLSGRRYKVHGKFKPGDRATSKVLAGFAVDVGDVFNAGEGR